MPCLHTELDDEQHAAVIEAMTERRVDAGEVVIRCVGQPEGGWGVLAGPGCEGLVGCERLDAAMRTRACLVLQMDMVWRAGRHTCSSRLAGWR